MSRKDSGQETVSFRIFITISKFLFPAQKHFIDQLFKRCSNQSFESSAVSFGLQLPILVKAWSDKPKALPNLLPSSYHPEKPVQ